MDYFWRVAARLYGFARKKGWALQARVLLAPVGRKGSHCRAEGSGVILDPHKLTLGSHVFIGRNSFMRCAGGVSIGSYTHISRNVTIHTANHDIHGDLLPYSRKLIHKPVEIGEYVWIGMNVSIVPGVRVGDGAVIGMGVTLSKDVAPGEIVVGPANRVIGTREPTRTADLVRKKRFLKLGPVE